jgi:mannose-6-phosphate isomerase-like protein (cupin superfamily)
MRAMTVGLCGFGIAALCGIAAFAQRSETAEAVHRPAPTDKILALSAAEVSTVAQELASTKKTTHQFIHENTYNLEVRRLVGPQPILQHAHKSDFMVIRDGEGTFMTGGELVDSKPGGGGDADDRHADSVRGGVTRVLKAGDVVFVPAGVPHGFVETKDHITFVMTRYDTK